MFLTVQINAHVRRPNRSETDKWIEFEFKAGVQKLKIPDSKAVLTLHIKGGNPKIVSITRTTNGKTYKLKHMRQETCFLDCPCGVDCWEDPILKQHICVCKPCSGGGGSGSLGAALYIGPC